MFTLCHYKNKKFVLMSWMMFYRLKGTREKRLASVHCALI